MGVAGLHWAIVGAGTGYSMPVLFQAPEKKGTEKKETLKTQEALRAQTFAPWRRLRRLRFLVTW